MSYNNSNKHTIELQHSSPNEMTECGTYHFFDEQASAYSSNDQRMMEFALWGSGLSAWWWQRATDAIEVKSFFNGQYRRESLYHSFEAFTQSVHQSDVNELRRKWRAIFEENLVSFELRFRLYVADEYRWILLKGRVTASDDMGVQELVGTFRDITSDRVKDAHTTLMSYAFAQTSQAMLILDSHLKIIDANSAFYNQIDLYFSPVESTPFYEFVALSKSDMLALKNHGALKQQCEYINSQNKRIPISLSMNLFHTSDVEQDYYIAAINDLSEQLATEERLNQLANFDELTGLLNRHALKNELERALEKQEKFALAYIDLDGFKQINDAFGHEFGDKVLAKLGKVLIESFAHQAVISRWGGDEIIALIELGKEKEETLSQITASFVTQLLNCIQCLEIKENGQRFSLKAQAGVAFYPDDANDATTLIKHADAALFNTKNASHKNVAGFRQGFQFYTSGMSEAKREQFIFVNDIREALSRREFSFVLQGKFSEKRHLIGAEILCRWHSQKYGQVSPARFIPVIEHHGMEEALGELALESAMQYQQSLQSVGIYIPIAVNISSKQFLQNSFVQLAYRLLNQYQIAAEMIELEITESVFMVDEHLAKETLSLIKALGFKVSLDDFGTGYSSLSYLSKYDFDVIKIDRQFILDLTESERAQRLFQAILNMCQALNMDTVVEGIETEKQFLMLSQSGVKNFQGFLLGMPVALDSFIESYRA
uniref:putative bifunctional diguanylate cyclase/phosphodiesterase n=1 Tax=Ningiella ruwaisensis TaxID=2364274 RepID=UPI0010A0B4AA|nr:GGDEF domain-containing phosphodiesterase [Ningiella ruwaisensis]